MYKRPNWKLISLLVISLYISLMILGYNLAVIVQHSRYIPDNPDTIFRDEKTFNCIEMTEEAQDFFELFGFKTCHVSGRGKISNIKHRWLGVVIAGKLIHFEPYHLSFFNPYDNYSDIYIRGYN